MFQLAVVGKTNSGKSTFFSAATLVHVEIASRPFVTIEPNRGLAYLRASCPCREFGVKCQPRNSRCENGTRLVPIDLLDVAGLVPGAHLGRGLGNQFLDDLIRADALIHVVDAAGATDEQGNPTLPGSRDPVEDVRFFETELDYWIIGILRRSVKAGARAPQTAAEEATLLHSRLSGLGISEEALKEVLKSTPANLAGEDSELLDFVRKVRMISKPISIAANKMDLPTAKANLDRLRQAFPECLILPVCAEAELALRRAQERGLIEYTPGAPDFRIRGQSSEAQTRGLERIRERILLPLGSTGVQEILDRTVYDFLKMIVVYPVASHTHLADTSGVVLPDAFIVPQGTTAKDLAFKIHTDIGQRFVGAIDARTKRKLGEASTLNNGDVIEILTSR